MSDCWRLRSVSADGSGSTKVDDGESERGVGGVDGRDADALELEEACELATAAAQQKISVTCLF